MTPAVDERAAPDTASGAAHSHQVAVTVQPMSERDFWRAVFAAFGAIVRSQPARLVPRSE